MKKTNKIYNILGAVSGVFLTFLLIFYVTVVSGEPYKVASGYIDNNTIVARELGKPESKHLYFLGYGAKSVDAVKYVAYGISVKGAKKMGTVVVQLKNANGKWKVQRAKLLKDANKSIPL